MKQKEIEVPLRAKSIEKKVWIYLFLFNLLILLADIFLNHHNYIHFTSLRRFFNMTREDGLGNWFSSTLNLFTALTLWAIAICKAHEPQVPRSTLYGWRYLACFYTYLAVDDATKFHERLATAFNDLMSSSTLLDAFPSYLWQLLLMPFLAGTALYMMWFLWRELRGRKYFIIVILALGTYTFAEALDFIEGMKSHPLETWAIAIGISAEHLIHYFKATEEFLENVGTLFFLSLFLGYLLRQYSAVTLRSRN
jgi:hypothetical protein